MRGYQRRAIFVGCVLALAVNQPAGAAAPEKMTVAVSVAPQAYFVERVGGNYVDVQTMVPPGANHETFEPTARQLVGLARARIYFLVGTDAFPFENRIAAVIRKDNEGTDLVNMFDGAARRGQDPHLWVSPAAARIAANNIFRALSRRDPPHRDYYRINLGSLLADINALDREIKKLLAGTQERVFMVYHPAWGYFAAEYGLQQLAIEEEGKAAGAAHLKTMIDLARQKGIRVLFVQKGFDTKSAATIAGQIGGKIVETDPLAKDWPASLRSFATALREALRPRSGDLP